MCSLQHPQKLSAGFTLIEAMVVIGLLGILAALAAPSMQGALDRYRAAAVYDELRSSFILARSEAIRTRSNVIVERTVDANCPTVQEWQCGWFIYVDFNGNGSQQLNPTAPDVAEPVLRRINPLPGGTVLGMFKGDQSQVMFDRWGNITPLGTFRQVIVPRGTINSSGVKTLCASAGGRFRAVDGDPSDTACSAP